MEYKKKTVNIDGHQYIIYPSHVYKGLIAVRIRRNYESNEGHLSGNIPVALWNTRHLKYIARIYMLGFCDGTTYGEEKIKENMRKTLGINQQEEEPCT